MAPRWLVWLLLTTACTRSTAPKARLVGEVASLAGVAGIITSAALTGVWSDAKTSVVVFAIGMGVGMGTYAVGELTDPSNDAAQETQPEKYRRWAKILTERAQGAAREHRCDDVRRLEARVRGYDAEQHDFVLMRDPEVVKCLDAPTSPAGSAAPPAAPESR